MCRLLAYVGPSTLVADVVLWPDRSIIRQSYDARERKGMGNGAAAADAADAASAAPTNHLAYGNLTGDGFGIGWFAEPCAGRAADPTPCVFTSVTPAW
jgi:predicted glutamine amidotransferase